MARQHAIFIVGPDGSGKTEVSTAISGLTGLPRFKCPSEKEWFRQRSFNGYLGFDLLLPHFVAQTGRGFVSDRGYPCEWVYSQAYGRMSDRAGLNRIDELWKDRGGRIVVLARRDYSHIEDDLIETDMLPRLHDLYEKFARDFTRLPHTTLYTDDYGEGDWAGGVAKDIIRWTARELVDPRSDTEQDLYDLCVNTRRQAQEAWTNIAADYYKDAGSMEGHNARFEAASVAYLHLTSGSPRNALAELTKIDRDLLPQHFWERLGMMIE